MSPKERRSSREKPKSAHEDKHRSQRGKPRWELVASDAHEWVSFEDPEEQRTWRFDVTFLLSNWQCIFGRGCQGVLTGAAPELEQGCCSYGAHFTDDEDFDRVKEASKSLTPDQWQLAPKARYGGIGRKHPGGGGATRVVDGACIFLNRPGFPGGAGCALHRAALERGQPPMELKPDVCWQLPLRRQDTTNADGSVDSVVGQWDRAHWGAGGHEFAWWCTEAPEAFSAKAPVWEHMSEELTALVGPEIFTLLSNYLKARTASGTVLPHPAGRCQS